MTLTFNEWPSRRYRVLLADEQLSFMSELAEGLRHAGYDVTCATSDEEARRELETGFVDVLVADIRLRGNAELQLVRKSQALGHPPAVILMTGFPTLESAISSVKLRIAAYLVKPFGLYELLEEVRVAVDEREQRTTDVHALRPLASYHAAVSGGTMSSEAMAAGRVGSKPAGSVGTSAALVGAAFPSARHADSSPVPWGPGAALSGQALSGAPMSEGHMTPTPGARATSAQQGAFARFHPQVKHLTRREFEVLVRVLTGGEVPAVARQLFISPHTVRNHLKAIYRKLDVRSRVELVVRFGNHGSTPLSLVAGEETRQV